MENKIIRAIQKINPTAEVSVSADDINTIVWENGTTPIPKADIEAKMVEVQAEYDAEEWKRNRQAEYPTHEDCIHALLDGGDTLTELQAKRTATKNKYPKPGA
jgi:copper chaperone CopZ